MTKALQNLEDTFLDHLLELEHHEGFAEYRKWIARELERLGKELVKPEHDHAATNTIRGKIIMGQLCLNGLQSMIEQRQEEIKQEEKKGGHQHS